MIFSRFLLVTILLCTSGWIHALTSSQSLIVILENMPPFKANFTQRVIDSDQEIWQEASGTININLHALSVDMYTELPEKNHIYVSPKGVFIDYPNIEGKKKLDNVVVAGLFTNFKSYIAQSKVQKTKEGFRLFKVHQEKEYLLDLKFNKEGLIERISLEDEYGTKLIVSLDLFIPIIS